MNPIPNVSSRPEWPSCFLLALGLAAGALAAPAVTAQAQTWSGGQGLNWNHAPSWSGGVLPANDGTADVTLGPAGGYCYLNAHWNVRSLTVAPTFRGSGSTGNFLNAGSFTLTLQTGVSNGLLVPLTLAANLDLRSAGTWADAGADTSVTGLVSGPGGIVKTGAGTLSLSDFRPNTFAGGLTVAGGVVAVLTDGSLGAPAGSLGLDGGALRFGGGTNRGALTVTSARPVTVGPGGGTFQFRGGTLTLNGPLTGPGTVAFGREPGFFTYDPGRYRLGGANTYAGDTTVTTATLLATGPGPAFGMGDVRLESNAVLSPAAADNLAAGRRVVMAPLTALVLRDAALDPATVVDATGRTTGGILALAVADRAVPLDLAAVGNGQLFLGAGADARYSAATLGVGADGVYRLGGGAVNPAGGTSRLTIAGHDHVLTGPAAVLVGAGPGLSDYGVNSDLLLGVPVVLGNANDFTGGTTVQNGRLLLGHDHALGTGPLTLNGGRLGGSGTGPRTVANPIVVNGGQFALLGPGPLRFSGPVDLAGGARLLFGESGANVTLAAPVANGSLTLAGGVWNLEAANALTGLTIAHTNGVLRFRDDASLGNPGATLTLGGGTLEVADDAPATLTLTRPVNVTNSYSVVRVSVGKTITFAGKLTTGADGVGLTKLGPGTLVLTGSANAARLSLDAGTLRVSNAGTTAVNAVGLSVYGPGTLTGAGRVGFTSVGTNARVAPGDPAAPGTLRVASGLRLDGGAHLAFRLGTAGADRLLLDGAHFFEIASFGTNPKVVFVALADAGGLTPGQTYTLVDWNTTMGINGVNAAAFRLSSGPVGGTFTVVNNTLQLSTAALTPFEAWQNRFFTNRAEPAAAPGAPSPAGDGLSNLLKYALGLDPTRPGTAGLPRVGTLPGGSDLTLTYTRAVAATDVSFLPQWSDDLATWQTDGVTEETLADDGVLRTVRARVAANPDPGGRRFLRLRVTQP